MRDALFASDDDQFAAAGTAFAEACESHAWEWPEW